MDLQNGFEGDDSTAQNFCKEMRILSHLKLMLSCDDEESIICEDSLQKMCSEFELSHVLFNLIPSKNILMW